MGEMILAGPDGQPAVDQQSGMPVTMEELLRRRGLYAYGGGQSRFTPLGGVAGAADPNAAATPPVDPNAAAMAGVGGGSTVAAMTPPVGGPPQAAPPPAVVDPATGAAQPDMSSDPNYLPWLLAAGAGGTAVGAAMYMRRRGRGNGEAGPDAADFGAGPTPARGVVDDAGQEISRTTGSVTPYRGRQLHGTVIEGSARPTRPRRLTGPQARLTGPESPMPESEAAVRGRRTAPTSPEFGGSARWPSDVEVAPASSELARSRMLARILGRGVR